MYITIIWAYEITEWALRLSPCPHLSNVAVPFLIFSWELQCRSVRKHQEVNSAISEEHINEGIRICSRQRRSATVCFNIRCSEHIFYEHIWMSQVDIEKWKDFCFAFGQSFSNLCSVDIWTKIHRFMRHIKDHVINLHYIRLGSSEEHERAEKALKTIE